MLERVGVRRRTQNGGPADGRAIDLEKCADIFSDHIGAFGPSFLSGIKHHEPNGMAWTSSDMDAPPQVGGFDDRVRWVVWSIKCVRDTVLKLSQVVNRGFFSHLNL